MWPASHNPLLQAKGGLWRSTGAGYPKPLWLLVNVKYLLTSTSRSLPPSIRL